MCAVLSPFSQEGEDKTVEQRVRDLLRDQQTVSPPEKGHTTSKLPPSSLQVSLEDHKEQLLSDFSSSSVKPSLQHLVHRYLHYNHYHLPMYAHPDIL